MQDIPAAEALMQPLQFNSEDLEANRKGLIGESQIERLKAIQTRNLMVGASGFFGFTLASIILLFFSTENNALFLTILAIFVSMLNALFVGMIARQWMRLSADIRQKEVDILRGTLERVVRTGGRMDNFVLRLNEEEFFVKKETFRLFRHEADYQFYRSKHSRVLLGAEPI